jgi:hypothetical protein
MTHDATCAHCSKNVTEKLDRDVAKMTRVEGATYRGHPVFKPLRGEHFIFAHQARTQPRSKTNYHKRPVKTMWVPRKYDSKVRSNAGEIAA